MGKNLCRVASNWHGEAAWGLEIMGTKGGGPAEDAVQRHGMYSRRFQQVPKEPLLLSQSLGRPWP